MKCTNKGLSGRGNQIWGKWVFPNISMECNVVQFCRKAFGKKYREYWIDVIYFDDKYTRHTDEFFSEVGIRLYPKISKVPSPKEYKGIDYRYIIWRIAHDDINNNKHKGVKPICIQINGVRYKDKKDKYREVIKSVKRVKELTLN